MNIRHILVPTDFGASAARALEMALDLATKLDASVTLLHAFMLPVTGYEQYLVWPFEEFERQARQALDEEVVAAKARFPRVDGVLVDGVPWERIVDHATVHGIDLVVMGTHGRKGLAHALLGSVADKVVRLAPCPVLTVGPERKQG